MMEFLLLCYIYIYIYIYITLWLKCCDKQNHSWSCSPGNSKVWLIGLVSISDLNFQCFLRIRKHRKVIEGNDSYENRDILSKDERKAQIIHKQRTKQDNRFFPDRTHNSWLSSLIYPSQVDERYVDRTSIIENLSFVDHQTNMVRLAKQIARTAQDMVSCPPLVLTGSSINPFKP